MALSFEMLLVIGVTGFYLFDSAMLIYTNELIFLETNGRWCFSSPEKKPQVLKKFHYFPNPLRPDKHIFLLYWTASESSNYESKNIELRKLFLALNPLRYMTLFLYILILLGLPLVAFTLGSGLGLLLLIEAIYLTILLMLIHVYLLKDMLGLSGKTVAKLSFDSLMCAPFALNLLRKITLQHPLGDPVEFASKAFDTATFANLIEGLCLQVDQRLLVADEGSALYKDLNTYRDRITSITI